MKKLLIIPILLLSVLCNAQFAKGGGAFLKTGSSFMSAQAEASSYCAEYDVILAAFGTDPTGDTLTWQNDMVYSLDSAGYYDRIKLWYVFANNDSTNAKINWASPGTYNLTNPGTSLTFVRSQGFDADGSTDYLTTGWSPRGDSSKIGLNSLTIASWQLANINTTYMPLGVTDAAGFPIYIYPRTSDALRGRINVSATSSFSDPGSTVGLSMITRTDHNVLEGYFNGASQGNDNDESGSNMPDATMYVLAQNNNGTAASFFDGIISMILVMNGVTDTEATNIYNILHRYMTRMGQ